MAETLEDKVKDAPDNESKEKRSGIFSSAISELSDFVKKALKIGLVASLPFGFYFIDPGHIRSAATFTYTVAAGHATANVMQKKPPLEGIVKKAIITQPLSWQIGKTFTGLDSLESALTPQYGSMPAKAAKVATWAFAGQPAVVVSHDLLEYGAGKKFRQNVGKDVKDVFKYLALPSSINVGLLYTLGLPVQMAVSGFLSFLLGYMMQKKHGEVTFKNLFTALNPVPYIGSGLNATAKLAKSALYNPLKALYEIGSNFYKSAPTKPPAAPPTPEPKPA